MMYAILAHKLKVNIFKFSHNAGFQDFLRTYPSSSYDGYALAEVLKDFFGYSRVTLIYSSDLYGTDGATEFISTAAFNGMDIVHTQSFNPRETDFSVLQESVPFDVRVYVMIIRDLGQASLLMQYMAQTNLIDDKTMVFGSGSMASSRLWEAVTDDTALIMKMMRGFFVIAEADDDWKVTDEGKKFITRFRAQPNTNGQINSTTGLRTICDETKDSEGGYDLYQDSLSGLPPFNCIGLNFSSYEEDG
jgi:ABC-type branched-subunit amino acid transport system substrate-binding protein